MYLKLELSYHFCYNAKQFKWSAKLLLKGKRYMLCLRTMLIAATLAFTGCTVGPDFHTPPAPSAQLNALKPPVTKTVSADGTAQNFVIGREVPAQWWTLFRSPEIDTLIKTGLANSPNVTAAQAALRAAQENLTAERGALMTPNISAQLSQQRNKISGASSGYNGFPPVTYNLYNASVNVSYTFDIFGANRRQLEALAAQVDYQRYQLYATYLTLTGNIVTTAITVASLQEQMNATQQLIQAEKNQLRIMKKQLALGGISTAALLAQQTQSAQTEATLPPLENQLAAAQHALAVLVGSFPSNTPYPTIKLTQLTLPQQLPLSIPAKFVAQRPDIQAASALLHAASAQVGVATANMLPQLSLSAAYGGTAISPGSLFNGANNAWNFMNTLTQPLFNGGSLRATRSAKIAALEQAGAQYQQTVLQAFQNVADVLSALETDAEAAQANEQATHAAYAHLNIAKKQLSLGGVSYLELLNADEQYQQALLSKIQTQAARLQDTAALFQALGGTQEIKEGAHPEAQSRGSTLATQKQR